MRHSSKEMFVIPEPYVTVAFEHIFEKNYRKQVINPAKNVRGEIRTPKTLCLRQVCMPDSITRT